MLRTLGSVSQARHSIVIGEDLGVVPPGFRDVMQKTEIQGYRVFFFEKRDDDFFLPPESYPREALACVTTHDLHTLAGWWTGHDIETRRAIGMLPEAELRPNLEERAHARRRLLGLLAEKSLLPAELQDVMHGRGEPSTPMPESLAVALHRLVARTPSRLLVAQAEDLTGAVEQVNIPGTMSEHPNWRRKLPCDIEGLSTHPVFRAVTGALREERPKTG
jgi:4-alpha-glucanotransferase